MPSASDCDSEMLQGYWAGLNGEGEPGDNRSHSFRHGWKNGRDDRSTSPRSAASYIREEADAARAKDMEFDY